MSFLELKKVNKIYDSTEVKVHALKDVSFSLEKGQFVVILGQSGAGKTTLLNLLGGMDTVSSGKLVLDGKEISALNKKELTDYRRYDVGFIFQFYNLINTLTAKENVELAVEICKDHLDPDKVLNSVGLQNKKDSFPSQLSGGEQQRVSIARAVTKNPKLLLCDEPTGALDYKTGKKILELLYNVSRNENRLVIIVTHNQAIKDMADIVINIKSGEIVSIEENKNPKAISEIEW